MEIRHLRLRAIEKLQLLARAIEPPRTSRDTLLALSEYSRRMRVERATESAELPLALYEPRVFSQNGEDGVIQEILRRTGGTARGEFVDFGASAGVENNCSFAG